MKSVGGRVIEGRNAVVEALKSGVPIEKLLILRGRHSNELNRLLDLARARGIPIHLVGREALDRLAGNAEHQGVAAVGARVNYGTIDVLLNIVERNADESLLVVLDGITDPHNMGAVIRSADGAGAHAVIVPKRRTAGLGEGVAKSSAGALFHVPIVRVSNISRTIELLKARGLWVYGIDPVGEKAYYDADMTGPTCLVIGGEHSGISRLVRERCDMLVKIPMYGRVSSLNASVAASVVLFEARKQREVSGKE